MMILNFLKKNYNKICMGEYCYDSWEELKIDVEWLCEYVYCKKLKLKFLCDCIEIFKNIFVM